MSLRSLRITNPWGSLQTIGRSVIKSFLPPPSPTPRRNRVMCVSSEIQKQFQGCFGTVSIKFCCQALLFHCIVKTSSLCYKSFSLSLSQTHKFTIFLPCSLWSSWDAFMSYVSRCLVSVEFLWESTNLTENSRKRHLCRFCFWRNQN